MSPRIFFNTIRLRSKNVFFHGAILAFFVICVITTFVLGIYGFARMAGIDREGHFLGESSNDDTAPAEYDYSYGDNSSGWPGYPDDDSYRVLQRIMNTTQTSTQNNTKHANNSSSILANVSNSTTGSNSTMADPLDNIKISFNIFTYTLPFVAFIFDHSTKRLMNLPEKTLFLMLKLVAVVYYLGAYVLALQQPGVRSNYYIVANANFILFPPACIIYAYLLRKRKLG